MTVSGRSLGRRNLKLFSDAWPRTIVAAAFAECGARTLKTLLRASLRVALAALPIFLTFELGICTSRNHDRTGTAPP